MWRAAVRWLTASAEQGSQYAQYALGKLYLMGEEIPEDREPHGSGSSGRRSRAISTRSILWSTWAAGIFFPSRSRPPSCSTTLPGSSGAEPAAPPRRAAANRGQKALAEDPGKEDRHGPQAGRS